MNNVLGLRVFSTSLDRADGALGPKKLMVLVAVLLVLGAAIILGGSRYIERIDTWEATVTGVAKHTVNFTFDEDGGEIEVAEFPEGMAVAKGDTVLIRIDENEGNFVTKVLDE